MKHESEIKIKIEEYHKRFDRISNALDTCFDLYSYELLVQKLVEIEASREILEWVLDN